MNNPKTLIIICSVEIKMGGIKMSIVNRLNSSLKENKVFYILVLAFFFVGIILGTYTIKCMNSVDLMDLTNYFGNFLTSLTDKPIDRTLLLIDILKNNLLMIVLILAFSFTIFGTPFILIIDLIKGFTLGYTFSFLLTINSGNGLWLALISIVPQNIIYIPFFIGISIIALNISSTKLKKRFFNGGSTCKMLTKDILIKFTILIILFLSGVLIETYLCPGLINFVITKVYKMA